MTDQILSQNIKTLAAALDYARNESIGRAVIRALEYVARVRADLASVEGQIDRIAPHPRNNMSRAQYKQAQARRAGIVSICDISGGHYDAAIAVVNDDMVEKYGREVTLAAIASFEAYVAKLAAKIGPKAIESANVTGSLWTGSTLRVAFEDGSAEVWTTTCIINVSVLGKLFNQWPTRKVG
jgi:hypothetical protein